MNVLLDIYCNLTIMTAGKVGSHNNYSYIHICFACTFVYVFVCTSGIAKVVSLGGHYYNS